MLSFRGKRDKISEFEAIIIIIDKIWAKSNLNWNLIQKIWRTFNTFERNKNEIWLKWTWIKHGKYSKYIRVKKFNKIW